MLLRMLLASALAVLGGMASATAQDEPFANPAREERFRELARELRCLVCQGESILDSNADLATDLREKVRELMQAGRSNAEIREYLTDRYGDFVLFRPPMKPSTWVLWLGPGVLAVLALTVAFGLVYRRRARSATNALAEGERARLNELLKRHEGNAR